MGIIADDDLVVSMFLHGYLLGMSLKEKTGTPDSLILTSNPLIRFFLQRGLHWRSLDPLSGEGNDVVKNKAGARSRDARAASLPR